MGTIIKAIVLAAGLSRRMGQQKLNMTIQGKTIIEHVISNMEKSFVDEILIVTTKKVIEKNEKILGRHKVIENTCPEKGLSSSLKLAINNIEFTQKDIISIHLGDKPLITSNIINELIESYKKSKESILRPFWGEIPGHPIILRGKDLNKLSRSSGDVGGKEIINKLGENIKKIQYGPEVILDIDTLEDYKNVKEYFYN